MVDEDIAFVGVFVILAIAFFYFCKIDIEPRDKGEGEEN